MKRVASLLPQFNALFPWERRRALDDLSNNDLLTLEREALAAPADGHVDYVFQMQRMSRGLPLRTTGYRVCPIVTYPAKLAR